MTAEKRRNISRCFRNCMRVKSWNECGIAAGSQVKLRKIELALLSSSQYKPYA